MTIDIAKFDDQLIDVITGWLVFRRLGYSVHACLFYAGSVIMPEPSASEWQRVDNELAELPMEGPHHLGIPLDSLLQRVPSENLKLLIEVFRQNREEGYGGNDLDERMRKLLDTLWERNDVLTKPAITNYEQILETLNTFLARTDEQAYAHARSNLLSLNHHLVPYLIGTLEGTGQPAIPIFSLLKALGTEDVVVKNLRRYAEAPKRSHPARYGGIARWVLDELNVTYQKPSDFLGTQCSDCERVFSSEQLFSNSTTTCPTCKKYVVRDCDVCQKPGSAVGGEFCWWCQKYLCKEHQKRVSGHIPSVFCQDHVQYGISIVQYEL